MSWEGLLCSHSNALVTDDFTCIVPSPSQASGSDSTASVASLQQRLTPGILWVLMVGAQECFWSPLQEFRKLDKAVSFPQFSKIPSFIALSGTCMYCSCWVEDGYFVGKYSMTLWQFWKMCSFKISTLSYWYLLVYFLLHPKRGHLFPSRG